MQGLHNHRLLADAEFHGVARTHSGYRLFDLGAFPAMVAVGTGVVVGEVYIIDDEKLARLDRLEGNGRWCQRTALRMTDGTSADAYLLRRDQVVGYQAVAHGD